MSDIEFSDSDSFFELVHAFIHQRTRDAIQNYTLSLTANTQKNVKTIRAITILNQFLLEFKR